MKIFKVGFDVLRYIVYIIASWIAMGKIHDIIFPEKINVTKN